MVRAPVEAERRQLTVLFCDLERSTELATRLDPEDLSSIIRRYHERCAANITGVEGYVAQYLGDGILAYFGYPVSHENDTLHAVRAGLQLVASVRELNTELRARYGVELGVRVGIHVGVVVMAGVGHGARLERLALGSVPNLAARIQGVAPRNGVVISDDAYRLVSGSLRVEAMTGVELRDAPQPTALYRVLSENSDTSRFDSHSRGGVTPFVDGEADVGRLFAGWRAAQEGGFRVLMLEGEAGIGKSRRIRLLKDAVAASAPRTVELQCTPETVQSALYPVSGAVHAMLRDRDPDGSQTVLERLEGALSAVGHPPAQLVPLLAPLLSIPLDHSAYGPPEVSPLKARELTMAALQDLVLGPGGGRPSLIVFEDLHWADASTLELLKRILASSPALAALVVLTRRTEHPSPIALPGSVEVLTIEKLSGDDARRVAKHVAGTHPLYEARLQAILERSDGVPLFVEELTKTFVEVGSLERDSQRPPDPGPTDEIPPGVRGLLSSRLDRMGDAKTVLQLASVLGRVFRQDVLEAISPQVSLRVREHLGHLVHAGMLFGAADGSLCFHHALLRDAAYATLLRATRRRYHQRVADVLLERFPEIVEAQPELVARHYDRAVRPERSTEYWLRAGQRALATNAHQEAVSHAAAGLSALAQQEHSGQRLRLELAMRAVQGMALIATEGYGSPAAEENFRAAGEVIVELRDAAGEVALEQYEAEFVTAWGVWAYHLVRADLEAAQRSAEHLERLAKHSDNVGLGLEADVARGINCFYFAPDFTGASRAFEAALAAYDDAEHAVHAIRFGQDPKTVAIAVQIWIDAMVARPQVAEQRLHEGLEHARRRGHPFSEAYLLSNAAALYYLLRDEEACRGHAESAIAISNTYGFPTWLAVGGMFRGWARTVQGEVTSGLQEVRSHLPIFEPIGVALYGPARLEVLSQALELNGKLDEATVAVEEAVSAVERTGERWYMPELERRRGELLLRAGGSEVEAHASLHRALELAQAHGNRLFELRAALSLQQHGQLEAQAEGAVAAALGAFAKDCSIRDVQDARQLVAAALGPGSAA